MSSSSYFNRDHVKTDIGENADLTLAACMIDCRELTHPQKRRIFITDIMLKIRKQKLKRWWEGGGLNCREIKISEIGLKEK